jgi:mRNA interferase RelE/StbE
LKSRFDRNIAVCDFNAMRPIAFTSAATRQWLRLSSDVRRRIDVKLTRLAESGGGDVKRLKGRAGSRLRIGDWRVIFYEEHGTIIIAAVGHRRELYEDRT